MDLIDRMLEHDSWATTQLLEVSRDLSDAQLDQQVDTGYGTLRKTLNHMISVVDFWTGLMVGHPVEKDRQLDRSVAELTDRHERFHTTFAALARQLRDEQRLDDTFVDHYGARPTFGGTIVQVIQHNVEHRTEALHILGRLGVPDLPEVDHLLWEHTTKGK